MHHKLIKTLKEEVIKHRGEVRQLKSLPISEAARSVGLCGRPTKFTLNVTVRLTVTTIQNLGFKVIIHCSVLQRLLVLLLVLLALMLLVIVRTRWPSLLRYFCRHSFTLTLRHGNRLV